MGQGGAWEEGGVGPGETWEEEETMAWGMVIENRVQYLEVQYEGEHEKMDAQEGEILELKNKQVLLEQGMETLVPQAARMAAEVAEGAVQEKFQQTQDQVAQVEANILGRVDQLLVGQDIKMVQTLETEARNMGVEVDTVRQGL